LILMVNVSARLLLDRAPFEVPAVTRAVVFDMDGTLVDTMPLMADLAATVMKELYGTPFERGRELYLNTCGLPFIEQLGMIYPEDPRNDEASFRFESAKPALCGQARMPKGTRTLLEHLRRHGIAAVVSSNNSQENVDNFVRVNGFEFDLALGVAPGMHKGKPHFDRVADGLSVERRQMLFVGDSLHDAHIAAREGVRFVGVTGTFSREQFILLRHPHHLTVGRLSELALLV
jgi:beta-phosphoglucomutase-like phosphatase (HAD superfamily)